MRKESQSKRNQYKNQIVSIFPRFIKMTLDGLKGSNRVGTQPQQQRHLHTMEPASTKDLCRIREANNQAMQMMLETFASAKLSEYKTDFVGEFVERTDNTTQTNPKTTNAARSNHTSSCLSPNSITSPSSSCSKSSSSANRSSSPNTHSSALDSNNDSSGNGGKSAKQPQKRDNTTKNHLTTNNRIKLIDINNNNISNNNYNIDATTIKSINTAPYYQQTLSNKSNVTDKQADTIKTTATRDYRSTTDTLKQPPPAPINPPVVKRTVSGGVEPSVVVADEKLRAILTQYELSEIMSYPEIHFIGATKHKIRPNSHFDDQFGSYVHVTHDHIAYRYEMLKEIGKGSFGSVVKAYDHKYKTYVALKMVRNAERFHQQALIEINILDHLRKKDIDNKMNVVHMFDSFKFRDHTCITFELLSLNLYELTKKNNFAGFSVHLVRRFAYAILRCLEALHESRIIHCDLKPENVLLKQHQRTGIKVIDFGSSCFEHQRRHTYIQSRFYRSPETILGPNYGMPIDMWSLGCILAELVTGQPLLQGRDEGDQLACMIELLDRPPKNLLLRSCPKRVKEFFSPSRDYLPRYCARKELPDGRMVLLGGSTRSDGKQHRGIPGSRTWKSALKGCNDIYFIDFVRRCLEWDPKLRLTPNQALRHPWIVVKRRQQQQQSHEQSVVVTRET